MKFFTKKSVVRKIVISILIVMLFINMLYLIRIKGVFKYNHIYLYC